MLDFANSGDVWIVKDRCIRYRFSKSHCRKCEDICLVDAIVFSPEASVNTSLCFNCGLCYAACPFSAVGIEKDNELLIKELSEDKSVDVGCIFSESEIKVACVSRLTEDLLLGWFTEGKPVFIKKGNCESCRFRDSLKYFNLSLKKAVALAVAVGLKPEIKIGTQKAPSPYIPRKSVSRRNLFSSVRLPGVKSIKKHKSKRIILVELLRRHEIVNDLEYEESARLEINSKCTLCGVCEHVCAADAILIKHSDEDGQIYFNPSLCINCGECEEACIYSALEFEPGRVSDMLKPPKMVFEAFKKVCSSCGKEFFASDEVDLCSACRAREESKAQFLNFLKNL